jgi:hypothetical protein
MSPETVDRLLSGNFMVLVNVQQAEHSYQITIELFAEGL